VSALTRRLQRLIDTIKFNISNVFLRFKDSRKQPLVSIVVPLFNSAPFVEDCLKSIRAQHYGHFECIIVNDASTDHSRNIAQKFVKKDKRFRIIDHETNKGLAATRNTGLWDAKGRFVTFLDSDDFLFSYSLWHRVEALRGASRNDVIGSFCKITLAPEDSWKKIYWARFLPWDLAEMDFIRSNAECPFNAHAPLLYTDLLKKFGGFKESMRQGCEDWELWLRVMRNGFSFVPSLDCGAAYRQRMTSMVRTMSARHAAEAERLIGLAFSQFEKGCQIDAAPYIYREALPFYQESIIKARRLVGFASMAYLAEDLTGFKEVLSKLDLSGNFYLRKHIVLEDEIAGAIARYYCVGTGKLKKVKRKYAMKISEIRQAMEIQY